MTAGVRAYWWKIDAKVARRAGVLSHWTDSSNNFGDELARPLLVHMTGVSPDWVKPADADLISIGSILTHVPMGWEGTVVGAGLLGKGRRIDLSHARVLALRGVLTRRRVRMSGEVAFGDPGLLAPFLVGPVKPRYDVGIVPHWSDLSLETRFAAPTAHVIRPLAEDPLEVIRQIGACRLIVSSSLHGVIVADAFGIPCRPERFAQMNHEGGDFKFRDYASVLGVRAKFGKVREVPRARVERAQAELRDAFRQI